MTFLPYLLLLITVVAFVCLAFARKGPIDKRNARERQQRNLEQQQQRFYQQQSWLFWHEFFNGRNRR